MILQYGVRTYLLLTLCHTKLSPIVCVKIVARARMGRRGMAAAGDFVVSSHFVGFWSKLYTQRSIRYRMPISIIKAATAASPNLLQRNGLSLVLDGQGDLQFDFKTPERRDQAVQIINAAMDALFKMTLDSLSISQSIPSTITNISSSSGDDVPYPSRRSSSYYATAILAPLSRTMATVTAAGDPDGLQKFMPKVINLPRGILLARPSMHFVCLTIGSRGDVQPYIALGLGLKREGHRVTIVTHEEYKGWVEGFGIGHRTAGGDPGALMKLSVEHKVNRTKVTSEYNTNRLSRCFHPNFSRRASPTSENGLTTVSIYQTQRLQCTELFLDSSCRCLGTMSRCSSASGKSIGNGRSSHCRST
jgi:sterol 3beta-glucosyltransferase